MNRRRQTPASSARPCFTSAVGLYQFSPQQVCRPSTEQEIVQAVQQAAKEQVRVRAIGALHSAVPLPATEGLCLVLEDYCQVVKVEGLLVTVQSGMRLRSLNDFLATQGLALPTLGTIAEQSVAGAISTGTHGGSLHCQSLSGYVQSLSIVRADGRVIQLHRGEDVFNAGAIALGALGIISTVTFSCVRAFSLQTQVRTVPMPTLLETFEAIHQENQFVDMRYSPITDQVHMALINPMRSPSLKRDANSLNHHLNSSAQNTSSFYHKLTQTLTDKINKTAQKLFATHKFNALQRWGIQRYDRRLYAEVSGRSDFVLTHFDATSTDLLSNEAETNINLEPVADMEVAISYDLASAALRVLREHFQRSQRFPSMHIHLRTQAAEPFWLSPTCQEPICWLEFWEYPSTGKFFKEMLTLLKPFSPRGHWGKQLPANPAEQYARWSDFVDIRQQWDPKGMFSNAYLDSIFQPVPSAAALVEQQGIFHSA
ncbi:MAG: D-arabinono-1,4-lactone oxidase [Cyanobacteria bacterium P01_A01_bin.116]